MVNKFSTQTTYNILIMINIFFNWCVSVLEVIGNVTGMGYELANIVIFVFLQPGLILLFFISWINEKRKKTSN